MRCSVVLDMHIWLFVAITDHITTITLYKYIYSCQDLYEKITSVETIAPIKTIQKYAFLYIQKPSFFFFFLARDRTTNTEVARKSKR